MTDLRSTFNTQAELYHAIRPHYPDVLFDAIIKTAGLKEDAWLLEIGAGTGQATESFAKYGYEIIAVELGAELASVGQKALAQYPNVQYINAPFEAVDLPPASFDLVYSATAFHWIDPEVRFKKPHNLLKDDGHLAIIQTVHVSDEAGDAFFEATQPIYRTYYPDDKPLLRLKRMDELQPSTIDENLFALVDFGVFPLVINYTAQEYVQLLSTYSPVIALEADKRRGFLDAIERLIKSDFGGQVLKYYAMTVNVAKKFRGLAR